MTTVSKMKHFSTIATFGNKTPELSTEESLPSSNHSGDTMQAVFGIIAFLSFLGNLVFCVVLVRKRYLLKKPYNILLLVLAVTDMLTGRYECLNFLHFDKVMTGRKRQIIRIFYILDYFEIQVITTRIGICDRPFLCIFVLNFACYYNYHLVVCLLKEQSTVLFTDT